MWSSVIPSVQIREKNMHNSFRMQFHSSTIDIDSFRSGLSAFAFCNFRFGWPGVLLSLALACRGKPSPDAARGKSTAAREKSTAARKVAPATAEEVEKKKALAAQGRNPNYLVSRFWALPCG